MKTESGRHPEDVAHCPDCGTTLDTEAEEKQGVCTNCMGERRMVSEKESAKLGKSPGIREWVEMRKAGMHCPPEGYDVEHKVEHKLKKKKKKFGKSMKRTPVESSNLKSVGYDPGSKKMHVGFHTGAVYEYDGVEPEDHEAMMNAESIGKHFNKHVRMNFPYRRIKSGGVDIDLMKARSKPWKTEAGQNKIERTMHEYKHGQLRSGGKSKSHPKVTSRKQAIAIALEQARRKAGRHKSFGILDWVDEVRKSGVVVEPSASPEIRFEGEGIVDYIVKAKSMKLGMGGRAAKLKRKLSGKVRDPGAVIGAIGRKKYGAKRMGKWAAAGRKRKKG